MKNNMKTPIYDFVKSYAESDSVRLHMPGHKGRGPLGFEKLDITEFLGADDLFAPDGIIAESENNATALFGTAHTFYSTEGSTLAIKAMLALAVLGKKDAKILASRAAHKSFLHAAALLDFDIEWIYPDGAKHLCDARASADAVEAKLSNGKYDAVYLTTPDYLGNITDVREISAVTKKYNVPLLVDNAHGAYLSFLSENLHPIALGADMCCDSAHKTLPVLTGGAYLHISKDADTAYLEYARGMLSLFASSSPSYLIMQSLDLCNAYLEGGYKERLSKTIERVKRVKERICSLGFEICEGEPLKIVLSPLGFGYTGEDIALKLKADGIEVEFFDKEFVVMMITPENTDGELERLIASLSSVMRRDAIVCEARPLVCSERAMSVREAILAKRERVNVSDSVGRVLAGAAVSCPPAIPIAVSGEVISKEAAELFKLYNISEIEVVKNA